jgi:hypothetical protein
MTLRNSIRWERGGKIQLDTNGIIPLPATVEKIKKVGLYKCPLRVAEVEDYQFTNGILKVNLPGRYLIEYE